MPYEIAVAVRLDDESGAAGLVFRAEDDKHYGFYPSGGKLRLTRFDGPDVFSWKVLREEACPDYRPGDWNVLKVRLEKDKIRCFVNDKLVVESDDAAWTAGKVGLAKFRDTAAEFKQFRVGKELPPTAPPADAVTRVLKAVEKLPPDESPKPELLDKLAPEGAGPGRAASNAPGRWSGKPPRCASWPRAVQRAGGAGGTGQGVSSGKEEEIDLSIRGIADRPARQRRGGRGGLSRRRWSAWPGRSGRRCRRRRDETAKREALNKYLFTERGFHGSRGDYYNRANSHLSEVLDDREGLPITLSVLYIELGRRLGLKIEGVGMPGHFVVRHVPAKGERAADRRLRRAASR